MRDLKRTFIGLVLVFILTLGLSRIALGDDSFNSGGSSSGESNLSSGSMITQTVINPDDNNAAVVEDDKEKQRGLEDDKKNQKGLENEIPSIDATGAFQFQYPLNLPPGTNGIAPNLKLFYNSNISNGMLGMGWTLAGLSKIERDYSYPVTYNDTTDRFMYDGERLVCDAYGYYHPAKDNYERIEFKNPNTLTSYWVVTLKNGAKMYFGYRAAEHTSTSAGGRIEGLNVTGADKTITWSLSKIQDLQGNYYVVEYTLDGTTGAYYPVRVTYTKNASYPLHSFRTVEFSYETRVDHGVIYAPTYTDMQRRLKWIAVKVGGDLLRKYRLDYEYGAATGRSRVVGIQEYGSDGNSPPGTWVSGSYIAPLFIKSAFPSPFTSAKKIFELSST